LAILKFVGWSKTHSAMNRRAIKQHRMNPVLYKTSFNEVLFRSPATSSPGGPPGKFIAGSTDTSPKKFADF
jgi:hypothetical protein